MLNTIQVTGSLITVLFIAVGCGTEPAKQTSDTPPTATDANVTYQQDPPKKNEVTVQYEKVGEQYAIALDDQSQLPTCTHDNDRQLAYTRKENKFFSCENTVWTEINVQGQAGAPGAAGTQGPKGDKGDPGTPVDPNQWLDPITNEQWLIGGLIQRTVLDATASSVCSSGWALASSDQMITAAAHGLVGVAHALNANVQGLWTSSGDGSGASWIRIAVGLDGLTSENLDGHAALACVKAVQQ